MATTVTSNNDSGVISPVTQYGSHFYEFQPVATSDIFVFTMSDGRQFAVSNYDDEEYNDVRIGVPQDNTINFYMFFSDTGGTFTVYNYGESGLGTPIYTFTNSAGLVPSCFRFVYNPGTTGLDVFFDANGSGIATDTGQYASFAGVQVVEDSPICFLRGTLILTVNGEKPVEELEAGDQLVTRYGGIRPIRWVGTQRIHGRLAGRDQMPVCIRAGAMGAGLPHTDLYVSPGPAILMHDLLVHASVLVNDVPIISHAIAEPIEYYHLDLGPHDCVRANGIWAESYFEDHNRSRFHNAATFRAAFPDGEPIRQETCRPIVVHTDPRADALHAQLAPKLSETMLSPDPDIHLRADGRRIEMTQLAEGIWQATLPAGIRHLRLRCRGTRPSMVSAMHDWRRLGLFVCRIEITDQSHSTTIPVDHPGLVDGWYDVEYPGTDPWRWTDGDAAIPVHLLRDAPAPVTLVLHAFHQPLSFAGEATAAPGSEANAA